MTVPRGFELDLGGIGKEYILKKVTEFLKSHLSAGMVNLGGDLMTFGDRHSPETITETPHNNTSINSNATKNIPLKDKITRENIQRVAENLNSLDGWSVGIADPSNPKRAISVLRVKNGAVLTSGNYERPIIINKRSYSHILNPKTLEPSTYIRSVTIYHRDPMQGGVLTTVANILGEQAIKYLENRRLVDEGLRFFCVIS